MLYYNTGGIPLINKLIILGMIAIEHHFISTEKHTINL